MFIDDRQRAIEYRSRALTQSLRELQSHCERPLVATGTSNRTGRHDASQSLVRSNKHGVSPVDTSGSLVFDRSLSSLDFIVREED